MRFYIFDGSNWNQVYVEVSPTLVKAQDTTNDSFACTLKATSDETPIKPMTPFKIIDDDNKTTIMWINNDSVSVFSLKPPTFKHSLTLIQYRYFLNKHLIRNTVFNQPRVNHQKIYSAVSVMLDNPWDNYGCYANNPTINTIQIWHDNVVLNEHNKILTGNIKFNFFYILDSQTRTITKTITKNGLTDAILTNANASLRYGTKFRLVDTNNPSHTFKTWYIFEELTPGQTIALPKTLIDELNAYIKTRSTPISLSLYYSVDLRPGDSTPTDPYLQNEVCITSSFLNTLDDQETYTTVDSYFAPITVQIEIDLQYFNYTMYDVIDILLKQYRLTDSLGSKREMLFNLPDENSTGKDKELYDLLTTTYPPDTMSFTQATFYDALTEIFKFYDAGFKFDENKTLQIEYYNDLQKEIAPKMSGIQLSHSDRDYNNGRVIFYQNAIQKVKNPRIKTRVDGLGVPGATEFAILVEKPIYNVEKLEIVLTGSFNLCDSSSVQLSNFSLDLTHFVFSNDVWSTLDKIKLNLAGENYNAIYQEGTLKFDRGSKEINVSTYYKSYWNESKLVLANVIYLAWHRFFGIDYGYSWTGMDEPSFQTFTTTAQDYASQVFNIDYLAALTGKTQTETINNKYKGEFLVNQANAGVDLNKMGLSMFAESLKDGEPSLTASCEITKWEDRPVEGDYIIYKGSKWVANVVNYVILPNGNQKCNIEFTRNFNLLSLRTITDQEKRLTSISQELSTLSEDTYIDYWYVTDITPSLSDGETIVLGTPILTQTLNKTFMFRNDESFDFRDVTIAGIYSLNINDVPLASYLRIPLIKYGAGNCMCFEMQYDSPINAGNQLTVQSGWFGTNKYFSQAMPYTDDEGWADKFNIYFLEEQSNYIATYPALGSQTNERGRISGLEYYKKPNEIFALNYEWCFLPLPSQIDKIFIGNKFINENAMMNKDKIYGKTFYLRYTTSESTFQYSIMDVKAGEEAGTKIQIEVRADTLNSLTRLYVGQFLGSVNAKTWAIVDENDDIYFASNNPKTIERTTTLVYFIPKRNRI